MAAHDFRGAEKIEIVYWKFNSAKKAFQQWQMAF